MPQDHAKDRLANALNALSEGQQPEDSAHSGSGLEHRQMAEPSPAPVRPQQPIARPAAPVAHVPAAIEVAAPVVEAVDESEDDDAVIAPPPPMESLATRRVPKVVVQRVPLTRSPEFKRTLIPPLLVGGGSLLLLGALRWLSDDYSPFAAIPNWMAGLFVILGLGLLGLGIVNVLAVKDYLETRSARAKRP